MQRTPPVLHRTLPDGGGKSRGKIARIPETYFPISDTLRSVSASSAFACVMRVLMR